MRVTIRGKRWNLRTVPLKKVWGDCDPPHVSAKEIRIDTQHESDEAWFSTLIHEFCHCFFPDLKEEVVEQFENDLVRLLVRLGCKFSHPIEDEE